MYSYILTSDFVVLCQAGVRPQRYLVLFDIIINHNGIAIKRGDDATPSSGLPCEWCVFRVSPKVTKLQTSQWTHETK